MLFPAHIKVSCLNKEIFYSWIKTYFYALRYLQFLLSYFFQNYIDKLTLISNLTDWLVLVIRFASLLQALSIYHIGQTIIFTFLRYGGEKKVKKRRFYYYYYHHLLLLFLYFQLTIYKVVYMYTVKIAQYWLI